MNTWRPPHTRLIMMMVFLNCSIISFSLYCQSNLFQSFIHTVLVNKRNKTLSIFIHVWSLGFLCLTSLLSLVPNIYEIEVCASYISTVLSYNMNSPQRQRQLIFYHRTVTLKVRCLLLSGTCTSQGVPHWLLYWATDHSGLSWTRSLRRQQINFYYCHLDQSKCILLWELHNSVTALCESNSWNIWCVFTEG